jgi:hypothetical protein
MAFGCCPHQVGHGPLGLPEECFGALVGEFPHLAEQHAGGGFGQSADAFELDLAVVAGQELEDVDEIDEVEEGQTRLVGIAEDQRERGRLGLVGVEHLGEELRAEGRDGGPDRYTGPEAPERQERDGEARRLPLQAQLFRPGRHLLVGLSGPAQPGQVALHVGGEDGNALGRELFGQQLERLRLPGAGGPGDQPVTVAHRRRDPDQRPGVDLAPEHGPAELDRRPLAGVGGGDASTEVVAHASPLNSRHASRMPTPSCCVPMCWVTDG